MKAPYCYSCEVGCEEPYPYENSNCNTCPYYSKCVGCTASKSERELNGCEGKK